MFITCGKVSIWNSEHTKKLSEFFGAQKPPCCGINMPQVFDLWFLTKGFSATLVIKVNWCVKGW